MGDRVCPRCAYALIGGTVCTHCGWVLPNPWLLLDLLDQARNHVTDQALRARIQAIVPPQPRDWPVFLVRFEHNG